MAYDYNKSKKLYEQMTEQQQQQFAQQNKNDPNYQQFMNDYTNDANRVNKVTAPTSPYQNQGAGNYSYNQQSGYYQKAPGNYQNQGEGQYVYDNKTGYYQNTTKPSTNNDLTNGSNINNQNFYGDQNNVNNTGNTGGNNTGNITGNNTNLTGNNGGAYNYTGSFDEAVLNKLKSAYGINSMEEFKQRYPEQYDSLAQSLESVRGVRDATNPERRGLLEGQLQGIIGAGVGAGSDWSKLNLLENTIMNKFQDGDRVKQDMQNIVKLQTEGKSIEEIARQMGISPDQVQQSILAYNGLDNKLGEYYKLKSDVASDITEPFDKKMDRAEIEKNIALERANRQVERLKEDFDTAMERQQKANEVNLHNADFISGQYGYGFSKRGIEGLQYTAQQAQNIIDDLVKNYDRNNQQLADGIADIIRNWERYNDDLMEASEDALTQAKNNYTSNMLAIQQQYGTVGLQAQQALSQNVQSFITQAESIYDNALNRQQQNLSNLITNASNLNALSMQNLTLRQAKIQQFQSEALTMNRSQLQNLANQIGMSSEEFGDLANYQAQAVANELNGYLPGAGVQLQGQIQNLLNSGYSPMDALSSIMNSDEFKSMQQVGGNDEWVKLNENTLYNKINGTFKTFNGESYSDIGSMGNYGSTTNYISSETVNGQTYGISENTLFGLQDFASKHQIGSTGGQCGKFVNDYLESLGLARVFTDPIEKKAAAINTSEGYKPQVGDIVVMDSPSARKYGHVAIVTAVNGDKITTLESNKKGEGEVFSRTIDTSKQGRLGNKIYGYYHPDGASSNTSNNAGDNQQQYNQLLVDLFNKDNLTSEDKKTIQSFGMSLSDFGNAKWNYTQQNQGTGQTQAEKMADAILSGVGQLPAKNSKEYTEMTIALHDKVKEIRGGDYPEGIALINYSVINDKDLTDSLSTSISSTLQSLYSTDMLIKTLEENDYKTGPILSRLAKLNPRDADYASIAADINQMSSNIARGFGEKGVLTDADIERYMKTIPNEKMGTKAREVVGTLLKAKLYDSLVKTLETQAKSHRDVSMFASDYQDAINWLIDNGFREDPNGVIKTSEYISPIQTLQNQITGYNDQSGGRIGGNIRAGGVMSSGKKL